mgnify:CR=1 FL=1
MKKTKTVLQEAQEAVYNHRAKDYGSVTDNFGTTASLWSTILDKEITPEQVGLCMIALKVSRQMFKFKRDNLTDIAGYAATLEKLEKGE